MLDKLGNRKKFGAKYTFLRTLVFPKKIQLIAFFQPAVSNLLLQLIKIN